MALPSTIHKAEITVSDLDRGYYSTHNLTLACHPSETKERLVVRLAAFCLFAHEDLSFGKGLSSEDEPALWQKDPTGKITCWIEVGLPEEKALKKASGRADQVIVMAYGGRRIQPWIERNRKIFSTLEKVQFYSFPDAQISSLVAMLERTMNFSAIIQDGTLMLASDKTKAEVRLERINFGS